MAIFSIYSPSFKNSVKENGNESQLLLEVEHKPGKASWEHLAMSSTPARDMAAGDSFSPQLLTFSFSKAGVGVMQSIFLVSSHVVLMQVIQA